jgi:hypothetical protein
VTTTPDLAGWLSARYDEAEQAVNAATPGPWHWVDPGGKVKQALVAGEYRIGGWETVLPCASGDVYPSTCDAAHIAAHDPQWRLADIARKRRLAGDHSDAHECVDPRSFAYPYVGCTVLRLLAEEFRGQTGWSDEWSA